VGDEREGGSLGNEIHECNITRVDGNGKKSSVGNPGSLSVNRDCEVSYPSREIEGEKFPGGPLLFEPRAGVGGGGG